MKEISLRTKNIITLSICLIVIFAITFYMEDRFPHPSPIMFSPTQYWHYVEGYYPRLSGGYGGAPDGEYTILISFINETDRVVGSPYCESYGGCLHGYWYYAEDLRLDEGWYKVCLEDNIIVSAEKME